ASLSIRDDSAILVDKRGVPEAVENGRQPAAGTSVVGNFLRAIRGEEAPVCPGSDALPVVRTTDALYRSAAERQPVRVM
ncbi:MAG: hypothetical protein QHJ73_19495, partial [Armatimonadota bacterium]|nr:hypothetical protein [Armatimonadota bacterium]